MKTETMGFTEQSQEKPIKNTEISALSKQINEKINILFGGEKENVIKNTKIEKKELENKNEVSQIEMELAKMFGKSEDMISLQNSNENITNVISLDSVMEEFDTTYA